VVMEAGHVFLYECATTSGVGANGFSCGGASYVAEHGAEMVMSQPASPRSTVALLVNGDCNSPGAFRARAFAEHLKNRYDLRIEYIAGNKVTSILRFFRFLRRTKPATAYVVDMAYSGVAAGLLYRLLFRRRLIIDTGDSIYALARSMGRNRIGLWLTWLLESCSLRLADRIVVRGTVHKHWLASRAIEVDVVQDGVESDLFRPMDVPDLRRRHGLDGVITVGLVGSLTWNGRLQMCYGSELIEALYLMRDLPLKGVIIGDGSGLERLKARAKECGIEDRVLFLGRIPYRELPAYLNMIDICLSTQTNDAVGQVRTTGKLPLYLACGRYVLASRVGEASLLLPEEMLVDYEGTKDPDYPLKLARKIRSALKNSRWRQDQQTNRVLAARHFDYAVLTRRLAPALESCEAAH
jgi:glycosyltransferase involved in cell wall biosynthesis